MRNVCGLVVLWVCRVQWRVNDDADGDGGGGGGVGCDGDGDGDDKKRKDGWVWVQLLIAELLYIQADGESVDRRDVFANYTAVRRN